MNGKRHTLEYVQKYFKEHRCGLLEKKYKNSGTNMKYKCSCGNISQICFDNFKQGKRCRVCADKRGAEKRRFSFNYVEKYFKNRGCKLMEDKYEGVFIDINYICKCGEMNKINFTNFRCGHRCKKCSINKRKGLNHYNYNPYLTDEEREFNKSRMSDYFYIKWRKKIFKNDDYICKRCGNKGGILNAHHIESWASNKNLRFEKTNGITFCESCHKQFHKIYGKINNNRQQLDEYFNTIALGI